MVPPWTPPVPPDEPSDPNGTEPGAPPTLPPQPAPSNRFGGARRSLGDFARTGNRDDLQRSLGHYVRKGYGGASGTTHRFGGTAKTASTLGGVLERLAPGVAAPSDSALDRTLLAGRSAREVMDAIVDSTRPVDGTQDAEAERKSINDALAEMLTRFPEADLLDLTAEQREYAIERFTGIDVFVRFSLDLGKTILEKAPSADVALARIKEAREYIKECVSASFRQLRQAGQALSSGRIGQVVKRALEETFDVFASYAE